MSKRTGLLTFDQLRAACRELRSLSFEATIKKLSFGITAEELASEMVRYRKYVRDRSRRYRAQDYTGRNMHRVYRGRKTELVPDGRAIQAEREKLLNARRVHHEPPASLTAACFGDPPPSLSALASHVGWQPYEARVVQPHY